MHGLPASMRRLAAAVCVNHRAFVAGNEPQKTIQLACFYARRLTTASPSVASLDANVMDAAYVRIANKMMVISCFKQLENDAVKEKIESTVSFLEQRLQMNRTTAIRTIALHPMLTVYATQTVERKLDWLRGIGVDNDALRTIVRRHPMILGRSEESLAGTKMWFLDHGIAPSKIPFLFSVFPQAASLSRETLNIKVDFLRDLGLDDDQIRRVLQRFPQVLTSKIESMATKVDVAKSLGVTDAEFVKLVTVVPEFLALSMNDFKRKLNALDALFGEGVGVRLWASSPRVIMWNSDQLQRTFKYLTHVVGMSQDRVSLHVSLIMRNVDRVVRPRYEYLQQIESLELNNVYWITMSESNFVSRHPDYPSFLANDFRP